jgi:hypothetical protein
MKTLMTALTLGILVGSPALVQTANAAPPSAHGTAARERIIQECMALQNRDSHDGYEGRKGGGIQWHYRACMTDHEQEP